MSEDMDALRAEEATLAASLRATELALREVRRRIKRARSAMPSYLDIRAYNVLRAHGANSVVQCLALRDETLHQYPGAGDEWAAMLRQAGPKVGTQIVEWIAWAIACGVDPDAPLPLPTNGKPPIELFRALDDAEAAAEERDWLLAPPPRP